MIICIIPPFFLWKPVNPLGLSFGSKAPKICFQTLVDNFGLTISLGVIGSAKMQLSALELEQYLSKVSSESVITVRDSRLWHAM